MLILEKSIEDYVLANVFDKFFKMQMQRAPFDGLGQNSKSELCQGNPFFSILINVYFNELDQFLT